jgi:hypothetical protein
MAALVSVDKTGATYTARNGKYALVVNKTAANMKVVLIASDKVNRDNARLFRARANNWTPIGPDKLIRGGNTSFTFNVRAGEKLALLTGPEKSPTPRVRIDLVKVTVTA